MLKAFFTSPARQVLLACSIIILITYPWPTGDQPSLAEEERRYAGRPLDGLISLLQVIPGSFEELSVGGFSGDTAIFEAIADYKDQAVEYLVNCMDSMEPAKATKGAEGRPVPLGVMCYVALRYTAYYEPEVGEDWQGIIMSEFPTFNELQSAKEAWKEIIRKGAYNLL